MHVKLIGYFILFFYTSCFSQQYEEERFAKFRCLNFDNSTLITKTEISDLFLIYDYKDSSYYLDDAPWIDSLFNFFGALQYKVKNNNLLLKKYYFNTGYVKIADFKSKKSIPILDSVGLYKGSKLSPKYMGYTKSRKLRGDTYLVEFEDTPFYIGGPDHYYKYKLLNLTFYKDNIIGYKQLFFRDSKNQIICDCISLDLPQKKR